MWTKISKISNKQQSHGSEVINREKCAEDLESSFCKEAKDTNGTTHNDEASTISFLHAVINMVGMLIGLGQLSIPYALENGGWSSSFLLISLGLTCTYTTHLLGRCLKTNPKSRDYKDIGQHAFGSKGRIVSTAFIYLEIFMALVSYTISLHDNLSTVFQAVSITSFGDLLSKSQLLATVAVLVALPSLWLRDLSSISFLSIAGIFMSILIFCMVVCTAIVKGGGGGNIPVLRIRNIPAVSGLYMFSFAGHIVFPNIYTAMKDPSKFTKVSMVSFALVTALYTSLAFLGAKLFGPNVNPQITLSMPRDSLFTKIALWATILTPMTKYALEFAPFAIELERNLPNKMKSRTKMIVRGAVGSTLLLLILVLALSVPYFEHVLSLTGSLVSVGICIVFPCVFYVKIFSGEIRRSVLVLNLSLVAFGLVLGAFGTVSSLKSLLESLQRGYTSA